MNKKLLFTISGLFSLSVCSYKVYSAEAPRLIGEIEIKAPVSIRDPGLFGYDPGIFGYSGSIGPDHWANLTPKPGQDNTVCSHGLAQSPIDLNKGSIQAGNEEGITVNYSSAQLQVENLGTTIEFPYHNGNDILINNTRYELLQFHLHTPSEHTIDGQHYPLEIHLVHKLSDSELAVLGIMVKQGLPNPGFSDLGNPLELNQIIPRNENVKFSFSSVSIEAEKLLPNNRSFYRYTGSLTTPPCSEVVLWSVFVEPIEMSAKQIRVLQLALGDLRFSNTSGENNRPVQPLNNRTITINQIP